MSQEPQAIGSRIKIDFAQASDPGRDPNKQVNEDSCGYAETRFGHLAVLCDGMGGHYGGREASLTAIRTIFEVFEQMPTTMLPAQALKAAIEEAGRRVYQLGGPPDNRARPGSTVVAMLLHDRGLDVAHVGDSRAYIIRSNQIYPLTRDHSMVQGMIDAGMLTEETAMGHPDSNKITRALGMKPEVEVELRPEVMDVYPGDVLLQSSDGLTDLALGRDILGAARQALSSGGVEHACTMLVKMANDRGGHDNITVQMVRVTEVGSKSTTIPEAPARVGGDGAAAVARPAPAPTAPMQVTSPDGTPAGLAYGAPAAGTPLPPTAAWSLAQPPQAQAAFAAPVPAQPSATMGGGPPYPPAQPALHETPAWTPATAVAAYAPQAAPPAAGTPPPGLAAYRIDAGPGALPLPPHSTRSPGAPQPAPAPTATAYGPTPAPGPAALSMNASGLTPEPGGFAPPAAYGAQRTPPMQPAGRGGIVFIVIGLSAVIAVLILVVLWLSLKG